MQKKQKQTQTQCRKKKLVKCRPNRDKSRWIWSMCCNKTLNKILGLAVKQTPFNAALDESLIRFVAHLHIFYWTEVIWYRLSTTTIQNRKIKIKQQKESFLANLCTMNLSIDFNELLWLLPYCTSKSLFFSLSEYATYINLRGKIYTFGVNSVLGIIFCFWFFIFLLHSYSASKYVWLLCRIWFKSIDSVLNVAYKCDFLFNNLFILSQWMPAIHKEHQIRAYFSTEKRAHFLTHFLH